MAEDFEGRDTDQYYNNAKVVYNFGDTLLLHPEMLLTVSPIRA